MNSQSFKSVRFVTKNIPRLLIFAVAFFVQVKVRAWEVDLSRRQNEISRLRTPAAIEAQKVDQEWLGKVFQSTDPGQEIVILNTDKGFVPNTINLKKGKTYRVHVVNVNEKEKNTSFIFDAFSEAHGTLFGKMKTFDISPKSDGIFSFLCPETSQQGRVIVTSESPPASDSSRTPAGE